MYFLLFTALEYREEDLELYWTVFRTDLKLFITLYFTLFALSSIDHYSGCLCLLTFGLHPPRQCGYWFSCIHSLFTNECIRCSIRISPQGGATCIAHTLCFPRSFFSGVCYVFLLSLHFKWLPLNWWKDSKYMQFYCFNFTVFMQTFT